MNHSTMMGPNRRPTAPVPTALDGEQGHQHGKGKGHNQRLEIRRGNVQAFDGTQHRNGRGEQAVAESPARRRRARPSTR